MYPLALMQNSILGLDSGLCILQTKLFLLLLPAPPEGTPGSKKNRPKDHDNSQPDDKQPTEVDGPGGPGHRRRRLGPGLGPSRGPGLRVPRLTLTTDPDHDSETEDADSDEETAQENTRNRKKNLEDTLQDLLDHWDEELQKLRERLADDVHRELFNY
ncbi:E4 protein [Bos taurus papillomavirus 12]|uniref:E4 protein n=1 Tax=Bos taurus papillomavirus 12 TaxID=1070324 RepID=G1CR72_9PAPI|nr:E4 protein [Bos taurus papillomavirus 12]AEL99905.1 E4 protein [Bos taurus papillomavirus 12]